MTAAKLLNQLEQNNNHLSIAHKSSSTPFYNVEECEVENGIVSVAYFNENDTDSELEYVTIPTKELHSFVDDFYGPIVVNEIAWGEHKQTEFKMSTPEYLLDNLNEVCTDYLNHGKGVTNV